MVLFLALASIIALTLVAFRYLAEGKRLFRLRAAVLAFDVLAIGWFFVSAQLFHRIGGPLVLAQGIVLFFMMQVIAAVLLLMAAHDGRAR